MRFAMETRGDLEFAMAEATSGIKRLGKTLVYSEPGPRRIRSALRMASIARGSGRTFFGDSSSFFMGTRLAVMRVSPRTRRPFVSVATRCTFASVDGKIRPRMARTLLLSRMASVKSPVMCVSAARKRLPKLWPISPRPAWKRYWKRRPSSASSLESATMQLRISPGGKMRFSRRRRPELPPSSVTVTMAARSEMGRSALGFLSSPRTTCCISPRTKADRPVPPPRATMRNPREFFFGLAVFFFTCGRGELIFDQIAGVRTAGRFFKRSAGGAVFLRIQQFSEARIFLEEGEVFIVTRVIAIFRFELNGYFQIGHGGVRFAGQAVESGEGVMNVIGFGCGAPGFIEAFAGIIPAAHVHHGDA